MDDRSLMGNFGPHELKSWREELGLSSRDFADAFGLSQANLVRVENGKASGRDVLNKIQVFYVFPETAIFYVRKYASNLHSYKKCQLLNYLHRLRPRPILRPIYTKKEYQGL